MRFSFSLRRMLAVGRKEALHLWRDHRMRPVIFVMPVIQMVFLGVAANFDVEDVPVVIVDYDLSPVSREVATRVDASAAFHVVEVTGDEATAEAAIDRGIAEVAVVLPRGTQRALARQERIDIPIWVDGTDTNRGLLSQGYMAQILSQISREHLPQRALPVGVPELRVRVLFNPALQSVWFMLPAILAMVLAVFTMLLAAVAVVKERETGTIEQLVVTPIRPLELIVGKLLPFVVVGAIVATLVTLVTVFGFGVPLRGSVLVLGAFSTIYVMSTLGLGLLASTVSNTQQQAMLAAMLILLPSFMMGGVFFPISNMPMWAQRIADLTPIRYFVVMLRALYLKGAGFEALWWETSMLASIGVLVLGVAVLRFRKRSA